MTRQMKDSGVEWIGEIPEDWEIVRTKNIATLFNGNSIKDDEKSLYEDSSNAIPYISTKDIDGLHKINYHNGMYVKKDNPNFKVARKNSTLMCIEGGSAGIKKGKLNQDVCFVNKLCCFEPKLIDSDYLYYFLNTPNYEDHFKSLLSGLIGGVSISDLKTINCTLPPPVDQKEIATFLNEKCGAIDEIIAKTEQSVEEYKKLKQSVITEAVTKGIRPNRRMKDSGIEWIGQIPENWYQKKLSELCDRPITYGIVKLGDDAFDGVKVLRCSDVQAGFIVETNIRTVSKKISEEYKRTILNGGEVIVNVRGTLGGCAIVPISLKDCNISREVAMISISNANNRFVMYYLLSHAFKSYQDYHMRGALYKGLNINLLAKCSIFLPTISEQKQIVEYLDNKCFQIDKVMQKKEEMITILEEYKKSLIYEYVTGKKEVV